MKRLATAFALVSSLASLFVLAGGGLALLAITVSGERGTGALFAVAGLVCSAAVALLVFAGRGMFRNGLWRAAAIAAALIGAAPPAVLAFLVLRFARSPFSSPVPAIEWLMLAGGVLLAAGAIAILALGHWRSQEGVEAEEEQPMIHMQQIRHAQQQLRNAFDADMRAARQSPPPPSQPVAGPAHAGYEDDVRVRRV